MSIKNHEYPYLLDLKWIIGPSVIQIMTQTANNQCKALEFTKYFPPLGGRQNGKHHLGNIECMPPIMISNIPIVLFYTQQPSTQYFVFNVKSFD